MSQSTTIEQLVELLKRRNGFAEANLDALTPLDQTEVDSIDLAYILAYFEREYDVDFADVDFGLERYETVGDLGQAIDARLDG